MVWLHVLLTFCIAAILAPFSYYAGHGARYLRLPQITGYLLSGIVCGPFLLGILSKESVTELNVIDGACLSIIGLAAGAELDLPSLQRAKKQVFSITAGLCLSSWVLCFFACDYALATFKIITTTDSAHVFAFSTLAATLMMTRSPASAIAVLKEMDGKGAFSSLVMAVVVVKDVVVIVAYALNMEAIRAVILPAHVGSGLQLIHIILPAVSVLLSIATGIFGGLLLNTLLRTRSSHTSGGGGGVAGVAGGLLQITEQEEPRLPHSTREMSRMALVLAASTAIFQFADYFEAEPLLACVTMGMVLVNRRYDKADKDREEIHMLVSSIMSVTNVAFFGLVGASLKLSALKDMLKPALFVVVIRLVAIYVGSWLGCYFSQTQTEHRKVFWASMVTQAGVALGLARLAGARFPDWGPAFQVFMMAIIVVNLLIGPPLFRWALVGVGEVNGVSSTGSGRPVQEMLPGKNVSMTGIDVQSSSSAVRTEPGGHQAAHDQHGRHHLT